MNQQASKNLKLRDARRIQPDLKLGYVGELDVFGFLKARPTDLVAQSLPPGIEPAGQNITPGGTHPVVCLAGRQRKVRPSIADEWVCSVLEACWDYLEIVVAVPFVRQAGEDDPAPPHLCATQLYLDRDPPIWLGRLVGFPKQKGQLSMTGNQVEVRTPGGGLVFEGQFRDRGGFGPPSSFPHFAAIKPVFEQVHIGRMFGPMTGAPLPLPGFVCAESDFLSESAEVQPVEGTITVTARLSRALDACDGLIKGIDEEPEGAFRLRSEWHIEVPELC